MGGHGTKRRRAVTASGGEVDYGEICSPQWVGRLPGLSDSWFHKVQTAYLGRALRDMDFGNDWRHCRNSKV